MRDWWPLVLVVSLGLCLMVWGTFLVGNRMGLQEACNTAGGILVAEEYCLPKTQVLKLTSP